MKKLSFLLLILIFCGCRDPEQRIKKRDFSRLEGQRIIHAYNGSVLLGNVFFVFESGDTLEIVANKYHPKFYLHKASN